MRVLMMGVVVPTGRQGGLAHEVAQDDAVHGVIALLEKVPRQQGQGKEEELAENTALRHVGVKMFGQTRYASFAPLVSVCSAAIRGYYNTPAPPVKPGSGIAVFLPLAQEKGDRHQKGRALRRHRRPPDAGEA